MYTVRMFYKDYYLYCLLLYAARLLAVSDAVFTREDYINVHNSNVGRVPVIESNCTLFLLTVHVRE